MKERSFLDTNVLVYTDDTDAPAKQATSLSLLRAGWESGNGAENTSLQPARRRRGLMPRRWAPAMMVGVRKRR
jgi:hypothetical protein